MRLEIGVILVGRSPVGEEYAARHLAWASRILDEFFEKGLVVENDSFLTERWWVHRSRFWWLYRQLTGRFVPKHLLKEGP